MSGEFGRHGGGVALGGGTRGFFLTDPVSRGIASAPVDDEPLTTDEAQVLAAAREWLKRNAPIPHAQVLAELGIAPEEIVNYPDPS